MSGDGTNSGADGWLATVRRIRDELSEHNVSLAAAGVAFFGLLALFPAIIGVVMVYALVADAGQVEEQLRPLLRVLPTDAGSLLLRQLQSAVEANDGGLTIGLVVSLVATVWAATGGVSALLTGLNIIYGVPESRSFIRLRALALGLTVAALISAVVALALVAAFPVVLDRLGLDPAMALGAQVARWAMLNILVLVGLSVLYRFGPARPSARWRPLSVGALVALLVWIAASLGFSAYVSGFGSYDKTYGSLAAVIVLMLWLYLSAFAVLLGAEIDAVRARRHAPSALAGSLPGVALAGSVSGAALAGAGTGTGGVGGGVGARAAAEAAIADMAAVAAMNAARIVGAEVTVAQAVAVSERTAAGATGTPITLPERPVAGRHRHKIGSRAL